MASKSVDHAGSITDSLSELQFSCRLDKLGQDYGGAAGRVRGNRADGEESAVFDAQRHRGNDDAAPMLNARQGIHPDTPFSARPAYNQDQV